MVFSTEEAIERNLALVDRWNGKDGGRVRGCMSLRQIIVCTPELISRTACLAEERDVLIQTHLAEGTYEVEYAVNRYSLRPAEYLESLGALSPRLLTAHSVLLSDHEVELYAKYGVKSAHCPNGNFSGLGMGKLPLMKRLGVDVGLGSDGASGGSIDLFPLMNLSLVGQLLYYGTPYLDRRAASLYDVVAMATIGAARAVRWDDAIGSLAIGKRADLLILDPSHLDAMPVWDDLYYTIAKCLRGRDVETVMIDGELVMEGRRLLSVDEGALKQQIREQVPVMRERFEAYHKQRGWI
jgi:5-methylthioadenosine/S-adenosylhomocysteine deaminase